MSVLFAISLLASCASEHRSSVYTGPVAAPQVAYRIDEHRYFEVVPLQDLACARARLFYTDTRQGIHVDVATWDRVSKGKLSIDATNDMYLVTPIILSSSGCQTGDGASDQCASWLYYSRDAGRSWMRALSPLYGRVELVGATVYVGTLSVDTLDLSKNSIATKDWERHSDRAFIVPPPQKAPIDSSPHCNPNARGIYHE